ncbi:MAG: hypothetical protein WBE46_09140 [Dehalococcoidia bacterium]
MKSAVKRLIRDEKGRAMVLALILLVVGGLIITSLLAYMSTGLIAGEFYERSTAELYAADAGVEEALWQLKQRDPDPDKVPTTPEQVLPPYPLGSPVNNKTIEVIIDMISGTTGGGIYKVTSTATSAGGSNTTSNTTIESYVQTFPLFWDHAITSTGDITLQPNSEVYGDVMGDVSGSGTVYGDINDPYDSDKWPFTEDFRAFFWPQVGNGTIPLPYEPCPKDTLDVSVNSTFGPGFHEGNLYIENNGGVDLITATLTGTVYIKGDDATLYLGAGGNKDFYLDLNYQTIYVEGCDYDLSNPQYALTIGGKVHIKGSGVIIAEGNIYAQPNMEAATEDDFVFVMSLFGKVLLQPNGTLYGTVAAQEVYLGPGNILSHTDAPTDPVTGEQVLSFPMDAVESAVKILTWDIS